jgi:hypothetical protein
MNPSSAPSLDLVLSLLSPQVRVYVVAALQVLSLIVVVLTALIPLVEKIVALTSTKRDDQALEAVRSVLSVFPRIVVPRLSGRPPPPTASKPPAAPPVVLKPDPADKDKP